MISSGCYEFVAPWCGPFLDAALNLKNAIGIGASLALAFIFGFAREARQNVILGEWELPDDCLVLARLPYIDS